MHGTFVLCFLLAGSLRGSNSLSYHVNYTTKGFGPFHGAAGSIAVYNPKLYTSDQSSESAITLTIGSQVNPSLYGDNKTRSFTRWTADNFIKTGCYNTLCPGFVRTVGYSRLGSTIKPVSTVNGSTYTYHVSISMDLQGNWWLNVDRAAVGYWPKNIFSGDVSSASSVTWGGGTYNPHGYNMFAEMGSGHCPYEGYGNSAFFDDLQLIKADSPRFLDVRSNDIDSFEEKSVGCYRLSHENTGFKSPSSFFFGGPGGSCTLCSSSAPPFLRSPAPLLPPKEKSKNNLLIFVPVGSALLLVGIVFIAYLYHKKKRSDLNQGLRLPTKTLFQATNNFASANEIGRGGFGIVYRGELLDGRKIAVKRMLSKVKEKWGEFQSEIEVLSQVRHRNLVTLVGYAIKGREKLLVYEYMSRGALSTHLFEWQSNGLEPLSWRKRLKIAFDIARGIEYLHTLTDKCFLHRDIKSSNILLDDDYRAKVSDFGLVRVTTDMMTSVHTRAAGTLGYLAPEAIGINAITAKSDVYSFGVVLLELLTGMPAIDLNRPNETQALVPWFLGMKGNLEKLRAAFDKAITAEDEIRNNLYALSRLAVQCTAMDPAERPDMPDVAASLLPLAVETEQHGDLLKDQESTGIDYSKSLFQNLQMAHSWQDEVSEEVGTSTAEEENRRRKGKGIEMTSVAVRKPGPIIFKFLFEYCRY